MASQTERREKIPASLRWGTSVVAVLTVVASLLLYFAKWDTLSHTLTLTVGGIYLGLALAYTFLRYRR